MLPSARPSGPSARRSTQLRVPGERHPELAPAGWRPTYPDYLYLAYTNATAFSPTDTLPVRRWTKLTMMVQSTLSLVIEILALALARASNVLPG